jgi:hypothetical protein
MSTISAEPRSALDLFPEQSEGATRIVVGCVGLSGTSAQPKQGVSWECNNRGKTFGT